MICCYHSEGHLKALFHATLPIECVYILLQTQQYQAILFWMLF